MGVETALIASAGLGVVGTGLNIYNSNVEAGALRQQGEVAYQDSVIQANQVALQAHQYHESQIMQYTMAGVSVQGTPMQALDYTIQQSNLEINSIMTRANNARNLAYQKANMLQSEAVGKGLASIGSLAMNTYSLYNTAKAGGIFDSVGGSSHIWDEGFSSDWSRGADAAVATGGSWLPSSSVNDGWGSNGAGTFGSTRTFNTGWLGGL